MYIIGILLAAVASFSTAVAARHLNGTGYEEGIFRDGLLKIINEHTTSNPLFLYYAPHIVHGPRDVPRSLNSLISLDSFMTKIAGITW